MTGTVLQKYFTERALIALSVACALGIFAFAGAMGLMRFRLAAILVAVGIAVFVMWLFWRHPILPFDEAAVSRSLKIISGVATIAALLQLARLCVFHCQPSSGRLRHWFSAWARSSLRALLRVRLLRGGQVCTNSVRCLQRRTL